MANKNQLIRYLSIDEMLRNRQKNFPTKAAIIAIIEERTDKEYSASSLEKDLRAMRDGFFAPIEFNNVERGYFYGTKNKGKDRKITYELDLEYRFLSISLSKNDVFALNLAESVLQGFKDVGILSGFSDAVDKVMDAVEIRKQLGNDQKKNAIVQLSTPTYTKGRELLSDLVRAINEGKQVNFIYYKFANQANLQAENQPQNQAENQAEKQENELLRVAHPYLLKEFKGRWYMIAYTDARKTIQTFGLDRISDLLISQKSAIPPEKHNFSPENYYENCFGVTRKADERIEKIILSFNTFRGNYIKTQPIHHSQQEIINDAQEYRISLDLMINFDLIMEILSYGDDVKVLEPMRLVDEMKNILQKTLNKYIVSSE